MRNHHFSTPSSGLQQPPSNSSPGHRQALTRSPSFDKLSTRDYSEWQAGDVTLGFHGEQATNKIKWVLILVMAGWTSELIQSTERESD